MAVSKSGWENWLERLYNLRRDKSGSHERPHKPALLLSIIDLLDHGVITRNEVPLSDELVATFKRYFAVVRRENDQPTIQNPFFHLSGDKFWRLVPVSGEGDIYQTGATAGAPSVAELRRRVAYGKFDDGMWPLLSEPVARHQLREALIARYFPEDRDKLAAIIAVGRVAEPVAALQPFRPTSLVGSYAARHRPGERRQQARGDDGWGDRVREVVAGLGAMRERRQHRGDACEERHRVPGEGGGRRSGNGQRSQVVVGPLELLFGDGTCGPKIRPTRTRFTTGTPVET